jgi:hypothetical protein
MFNLNSFCASHRSFLTELEEHIKSLPGKLTVFPFMMTHHNFEEAPNWVRGAVSLLKLNGLADSEAN